MIRVVIFDWGDTLMRDFPDMQGSMAYWPTVQVVEGVTEALDCLDPSLVCCVASNAGASDEHLMALALDRGGIRNRFQHFFTSKELGATKPDIRFFHEITNQLGVAREECVMVGNDYVKDISGAKQAGLHTVWLAAGFQVSAGRDLADVIITSMVELPSAIGWLRRTEVSDQSCFSPSRQSRR